MNNPTIMKQMNKSIIYAILCTLFLVACNEKEVPGYAGDDALYFYRGTYGNVNVFQRDSIFYSFLTQSGNKPSDTVYVDIRTMGMPQNYERQIAIEQTNMGGEFDAQAGVHYVDFRDSELQKLLRIPAGAVMYKMPVVLLRDASLQTKIVNLKIKIVENEYFKAGIDEQASFIPKFSDQLLPSVNWRPGSTDGWTTVFGAYGTEKHRFVINYVGFTDFDGDVSSYPLAVRRYLNEQARKKLTEYNAAHPGDELKEANGDRVSFPVI
jgi:hypothetical protein